MRTGSFDNKGKVTIYTLETQHKNSGNWYEFQPTRVDLGEPPVDYYSASTQLWKSNPLSMTFSASGDCWQRYGIFGTTNADIAQEAARACTKNGLVVRIVQREYEVRTQEIGY